MLLHIYCSSFIRLLIIPVISIYHQLNDRAHDVQQHWINTKRIRQTKQILFTAFRLPNQPNVFISFNIEIDVIIIIGLKGRLNTWYYLMPVYLRLLFWGAIQFIDSMCWFVVLFLRVQVNYPKKKNTYCKKCDKHESHAITWQKKAGKASTTAQGTKQWQHSKRMENSTNKQKTMKAINRKIPLSSSSFQPLVSARLILDRLISLLADSSQR